MRDGVWQDAFREQSGNEPADHAAALERHYARGPDAAWQETHVSACAAAHPWEDFAEIWAHYLHIVDTLEAASTFTLRICPKAGRHPVLVAEIDLNPYEESNFDVLFDGWLPVTYAANSLNASMGQPELYPFVLAPAVVGKLRFVHGLIHAPDG